MHIRSTENSQGAYVASSTSKDTIDDVSVGLVEEADSRSDFVIDLKTCVCVATPDGVEWR